MTFPFLSLPGEIRLKVYELALARRRGISPRKALHLLLSCRQISAEVAQVLYGEGGVRVFADNDESVSDTLKAMGSQNRRFIRRLEIDWTTGSWSVGFRAVEQLIEDVYRSGLGRTHGTSPSWLRVIVQSFLASYYADVMDSLQLLAPCRSLRDLTLLFPGRSVVYGQRYDVGFCVDDHFLLRPEIRQALVAIKGVSILTIGRTMKFKETLTLAEEMGVTDTLEVKWLGEGPSSQVLGEMRKDGWEFDIDHWETQGMASKKMRGSTSMLVTEGVHQ